MRILLGREKHEIYLPMKITRYTVLQKFSGKSMIGCCGNNNEKNANNANNAQNQIDQPSYLNVLCE